MKIHMDVKPMEKISPSPFSHHNSNTASGKFDFDTFGSKENFKK